MPHQGTPPKLTWWEEIPDSQASSVASVPAYETYKRHFEQCTRSLLLLSMCLLSQIARQQFVFFSLWRNTGPVSFPQGMQGEPANAGHSKVHYLEWILRYTFRVSCFARAS